MSVTVALIKGEELVFIRLLHKLSYSQANC